MKITMKKLSPFKIFGLDNVLSNLHIITSVLFGVICAIPGQGRAQCISKPFPDQWVVHELETSEFPYRLVYIYADFDIDGDGRKDIVTGQWWYRNPGSASGNWVRNTIGGSFRNMAHIHDFDGDGDLDMLGTTGAYTGSDMVWAENNGSGSFTIHSNIPSGDTNFGEPFLAGIAGANFQNGGPYQMAINWNGAESTGSPVQMLTVPADPVNTAWPLVNISSSSLGEDLQKGDIDGDGDLDLFQSKNWLRNNGNGTWTTIDTGIDYVTTPDRAQLSDFDGDGDLDAVVGQLGLGTNPARMDFAWFEAPSNPEQNWTRHTLATDINGSLSVFAEDIDQDGDDDIIVGEWKGNNRLIAFENDLCNSGTWIRHTINAGGTGFDHHDGARVVDIDNDGDFDIVSIGWDNIVPRIFENTTSTTSNELPLANAGSNQNVTLPNDLVTLNGSGSDPDGGNVAFQWTQQSGPDTAILTGDGTKDLTASGLTEGNYVFRLTVTDDENETAFNDVTVTVNPAEIVTEQPVVNAGANQSITLPENSVSLPGSGSDPDGGEVSFQWTQQSGPDTAILTGDSTKDLTASGLTEGNYVFRLTVSDDENETVFDEVTVTVNPAVLVTENPVVNAGADQNLTLPDNSISLTGSGSDPDGGEVSFQWNQQSGPNTATLSGDITAKLSASELIEGNYVFRLTVTDDENETVFDEVTVTVNPAAVVPENPDGTINEAPIANATATPLNGEAPLKVNFNASDATDDIAITSYTWDFGNGATSSEINPAYTFETPGAYKVTLTVADAEELTDTAEISIVVSESVIEISGIRLETNPVQNGTAKLLLINQPEDVQVVSLFLHDSAGRLIKTFDIQEISAGAATFDIPVATLRDGVYHIGIKTNKADEETISMLVRN